MHVARGLVSLQQHLIHLAWHACHVVVGLHSKLLSGGHVQVETSADVGYNVGTGIDVSVYNTIATVCQLKA